MGNEPWVEVDRYLEQKLLPKDPVLEEALRSSAAEGLPNIQVSPTQGRFLELLARSIGARNVLEIGTLGGYSAIHLARALPIGGRLISLEIDPTHAEVARRNLERAGLSRVAEVRLGPALDTLPRLLEEGVGPFDLSFLDADKAALADYFDWAVRLSHPGSLIVIDNVVRQGRIADGADPDPSVVGVRRLIERVASEAAVRATALQTVGRKGYDGFLLAVVHRAHDAGTDEPIAGVPWTGDPPEEPPVRPGSGRVPEGTGSLRA